MPVSLHGTWDRLVASDPGLSRLRTALGGAGSLATALGVELLAATLLGAQGMQVLLFLLMGGMVAMMGSMLLSGLGPGAWTKVKAAVFFPVAFGTGISISVASQQENLVLVMFVVMTFAAVFVRRFGIPFFFYGFMGWIGYLFASLLGATFAMLPMLLLALTIGTGWVLLLSLTVFRAHPMRTLTRTVRAFHARVRTLTAVCAELGDVDAGDRAEFRRWQSRLHRHQRRLSEAALMIEASSGEQQAVPDAATAQRLRNYALEAQLAIDALATSVEAIAIADPAHARAAAAVAQRVIRRDLPGAAQAAERLQDSLQTSQADGTGDSADWWPAHQLAEAIAEFRHLADQVSEFSPAGLSRTDENGAAVPDEDEPEPAEFRPAVGLMMGNLPSSAALARGVTGRGPQWLLARMSMTTRQAIQVAVASGLAILAGHALSGHRYYWALIAVFVTFTGTATRAESVRKAVYRLVGTLAGLVVAMLLAHVTAGHPPLVLGVIVGSVFCGFYLIRISYAFMIFFITIMVAQLYNVLGEYSNQLLVLRLEETAIGAAIGIAVALAFLPLSTRDTVRTARDNVLHTLAEALTRIADSLDETAPGGQGQEDSDGEEMPELEELARQLDDNVRQLDLVATPFSRPAMWGNNGRHVRYRLTRFAAIAGNIRTIAVVLRRTTPGRQPALADISRALADTATGLTRDGQSDRSDPHSGTDAEPVREDPSHDRQADGPPPHHALTRSLTQINDLLAEIGPTIPEHQSSGRS